MLRTISAVIIYLCINIVTGTLAGIPTIEKLIFDKKQDQFDTKFSFLVQYYIITIAIAISTQLIAIQAIDKVWELLDRAS